MQNVNTVYQNKFMHNPEKYIFVLLLILTPQGKQMLWLQNLVQSRNLSKYSIKNYYKNIL